MKSLADDRCAADLLRRLGTLRADSKPQWGTMTAGQMVCHLTDAFRMSSGDLRVSPASGVLQRTVVKWIALYAPMRWPPGIQTRPEIDQVAGGGTRPIDFAADVEELKRLLQAFASCRGLDRSPHPIFGRMSGSAWLRWGYLHTDHHLRQFGA